MSSKTWSVVSMLVLAVAPAVEAQSGTNGFVVQQWQTSDGLPENLVNSLVQTRDGYLWVGTFGGLARFDGSRFVTFGEYNSEAFPNNHIVQLYESHDGSLWICFDHGTVVRYQRGRFTQFTTQQGLRNLDVKGFAEDSAGNLWVGGLQGLDRWQDGKFVVDDCGKQLGGQSVQSLRSGRSGRVWMTTSKGLYVIEDAELKPYRLPESVVQLGRIFDAYEDNTGHLWIFGGGFGTRVPLHEVPEKGTEDEPFFRNAVRSFCAGSDGEFWFGTEQHGLYRWREGRGTNFEQILDVSSAQIRTICEDREHNIWVGTTAGGLNRVRRRTMQIWPITGGSGDQDTLTVAEDSSKRIWVGTYMHGLFCSASDHFGAFRREKWPQDLSGPHAPEVASVWPARDGSLWDGSWSIGLSRIKDGQTSHFGTRNGLPNDGVESIFEEKDGSIWVGTFGQGLSRFNGQKFATYGPKDGLDGKYFTSILRTRDGTLWAGSEGWGVYRQMGRRFISYGKKSGLLSNIVLTMFEDKEGNLWVGTQGDGGLSRWCGDHFVSFTRRSGLPADATKQILEDDSGNLWLGSNRGIIQVSKSELNDVVAGRTSWIHAIAHGREDGLINIECRGATQPSACKTSDGKLLFATHDGLVVIDPRQISSNRRPPPVIIEDVLVGGRPVWSPDPKRAETASASRSPAFDVQLQPHDQGCEFQYASPSLVAPDRVQFKYQLEGLDARWTEAGTRRSAVYEYLPPGKYRFRVVACNEKGAWNDTEASVTLYRPRFFWQTNWFLGLVFLVTAAAITIAVRVLTKRRMRHKLEALEQQHALERERSRIARDIHDELGASLTKISKLTEIADRWTDSEDRSRPLMQNIAGTAHDAIQSIDEIVWAVNPRNDTVDEVANYLVHFAQEFLRSSGVTCQLDVPFSLPDMPVSAEVRHNLLMSAKEALNNAVKHGVPTTVRVALKLNATTLTIEISDDGSGFLVGSAFPHGSGLENMRKRMAAVGGETRLLSQPGSGTTVALKVALLPSNTRQITNAREN